MVKIWTIQMGSWRLAKQREIKFLDITAKSGIQEFAPEMSNVLKYKAGELTEQRYTELYREKMLASQSNRPGWWDRIGKLDEVVFACYCKPNTFCHRHLFVELVTEYLKRHDIAVELMGELTKETA